MCEGERDRESERDIESEREREMVGGEEKGDLVKVDVRK